MANLVSNLVHAAAPTADTTLATPSGIRAEWYPGNIRYIELYNLIPFNIPLAVYTIPAGYFLAILEALQSTEDAFYFAYGITQTLYITADGLSRGFINATWQNGTAINPTSIINVIAPVALMEVLEY